MPVLVASLGHRRLIGETRSTLLVNHGNDIARSPRLSFPTNSASAASRASATPNRVLVDRSKRAKNSIVTRTRDPGAVHTRDRTPEKGPPLIVHGLTGVVKVSRMSRVLYTPALHTSLCTFYVPAERASVAERLNDSLKG